MWYKGIVSSILVCVIVYGIAVFGTVSVGAAESAPDVSVKLLEEPRVSDSEIAAEILVEFNDENLYNDEVYLSYHILNATGEIVVNENERIKIDLDSQGNQKFELTISYADAKLLSEDDRLIVMLDIVDEKNAFWFSDRDTINFRSTNIDTHRTVGQKLMAEIRDSKVAFGINAIVFIFCIAATVYLYRKSKRNT